MTPTPACTARARRSDSACTRRAEHGEPRREQPRVHAAVGVDEIGPDQPVDGDAERQREHGGGVGRQAGREVFVDDDHATFCSLSGFRRRPVGRVPSSRETAMTDSSLHARRARDHRDALSRRSSSSPG